jgi:hypothetical protein
MGKLEKLGHSVSQWVEKVYGERVYIKGGSGLLELLAKVSLKSNPPPLQGEKPRGIMLKQVER